MNEPKHKTLAEWSLPKRVIHGPYSEGESESDRLLRLEREEAERTSALVMRVLIVMALIVIYVIVFLILQ